MLDVHNLDYVLVTACITQNTSTNATWLSLLTIHNQVSYQTKAKSSYTKKLTTVQKIQQHMCIV